MTTDLLPTTKRSIVDRLTDWHKTAIDLAKVAQENFTRKDLGSLIEVLRIATSMERTLGSLEICQNTSEVLDRLAEIENHNQERHAQIMGAIADFAAKQEAFNTRLEAGIDVAQTALTGLTADVEALNKKITDLQNTAGQITPEDQALLDGIESAGARIATRMEAFSNALKALDDLTPPSPPAQPQ